MAAAAVGAIATLGGAVIGSRSQNRAMAAQQQANNQALAYERERQAVEDQRYNDRWQDYLARHKAWEQRNFGGGATQTFTSRPAAAPAASMAPPMGAGAQAPAMAGEGRVSTQRPEGQTLADWSDWRNYIGANQ